MTTTNKKRVAIIGAGASGIVAAKNVIDHGLETIVFEKRNSIGGLWSASNRTAVWEGLNANLSIYSISFLDHSYPKLTSITPNLHEINQYLVDYVEKYQLNKYLRLSTKVEQVAQLDDKKWILTYTTTTTTTQDESIKQTVSEIFDFLIVASGIHSKPRIPNIENMENFKGLIIHSSEFKPNDERLKSKRVIVVGASFSGVDISSNLVDHAESILNIYRRTYLISQRLVRLKSLTKNLDTNVFNIVPMDFIMNNRVLLKNNDKTFIRKFLANLNPEQTNKEKSHPELYYELNLDEMPLICVSDGYYSFVKQNKIRPKKATIKRFEADGVYLNDDTFEKADVVLFCTGYDSALEFLDEKTLRILNFDNKTDYKFPILLYKYTLHPELDNFAMVCQTNGILFSISEMQSKWAAMLFAGKLTWPDKKQMLDEIEFFKEKRQMNLQEYCPFGPNVLLMENLAEQIGVLSDFKKLMSQDPTLNKMLNSNLLIPSEYFLATNRDYLMPILNEIDLLMNKEYLFDDDDQDKLESISKLAEKFSVNKNYSIPKDFYRT